MVPAWVALAVAGVGVFGTLMGAALNQILTNRREARRDQLKWAQDRQQRELDDQQAAVSACLLAINAWLQRVLDCMNYLRMPGSPKPNVSSFDDLEAQASRAWVPVELLCSNEAKEATRRTLNVLQGLSQRAVLAVEQAEAYRADDPDWRNIHLKAFEEVSAVDDLTNVYRDELAKLKTEPVAMPKGSREPLR